VCFTVSVPSPVSLNEFVSQLVFSAACVAKKIFRRTYDKVG
jgi:hypothetical protein